MAVTNYYTVDGQIIGEKATGSVRTDYMIDSLGSVVGTTNKDNTVNRGYTYKPYGTLLESVGSGNDPKFLWVGAPGYRVTNRSHSSQYVRARHYGLDAGRWTSLDPHWQYPSAFTYCDSNPDSITDPTGLEAVNCKSYAPCPPDVITNVNKCCKRLKQPLSPVLLESIIKCVKKTRPGLDGIVGAIVSEIARRCGKGSGFAINCPPHTNDPFAKIPDWPPSCNDNPCRPKINQEGELVHNVDGVVVFKTPLPLLVFIGDLFDFVDLPRTIGGCSIEEVIYVNGKVFIYPGGCVELTCNTGCAFSLCQSLPNDRLCEAVYHELAHCTGLSHGSVPTDESDLVSTIGKCMDQTLE